MTKKDTELTATTSFIKTDVLAVTTGVAAMVPVTKKIVADNASLQLSAWRIETVVIEILGFTDEPETGVIEGISFSMPFDCEMIGAPSMCIQDEQEGVASSSGPFEVDILKNGVSILSPNMVIDQGELNTSTATSATVTDATLDAFDQYTFNVVDAGVSVVGPVLVMFELRKV